MREPFASADSQLELITADLRSREPIFHRPESAHTIEQFARMMAPDYWEIGASGRVYTRSFILEHLAAQAPVDAVQAGWQVSDFACRHLAPNTYLVTYHLQQGERPTRRSTLWQRTPAGWHILYHQGTVVAGELPNQP